MEYADKSEEALMIDFESGIDTWVIDKDDSVGSALADKTIIEATREENMNKENIKQSASSNSKSLRSFRIRKRVSYQEFSSESESESNKKLEENYGLRVKRRSNPSSSVVVSKTSAIPASVESKSAFAPESESGPNKKLYDKCALRAQRNSDPLNQLTTKTSSIHTSKEVESLSSEEISSMLSEADDVKDCSPVSNRERLHSIENVSTSLDYKIGEKSSPTKFKCDKCFKERCGCDFNEAGGNYKNGYQNLHKRNHSITCGTLPAIIKTDKTSSLKIKLEQPILIKGQSLKCEICGYLSAELLIYKSHQILFHSEKTNLECEYCDFKTSQCASLATHIRVHFQMDCPYCDYHCSLKSSLKNHLLRYHQNAHPYNCKTCNYSCKSQSTFYDHLQMHAIKKYQCSECKQFFSSKQTLKVHVKKHLRTANVFKCCKCDLRFSQKQSLNLHLKCHEKPNGAYVCRTCKASFSRKYDFITHSKTHVVAPKILKCEKCESTFSQGNRLKLHMRTHLQKYTKCKHCDFQSTNINEVNNHICVPINKLYRVQKRSLNFESDKNNVKVKKIKTEICDKEISKRGTYNEKHVKNMESSILSKNKVIDTRMGGIKKFRKTPKVLAVRQNLRCFKTEKKSERGTGKPQNKKKNPDERRGRPRKNTVEPKLQTLLKRNGVFQNGGSVRQHRSIGKVGINIKEQKKLIKKIRKERLSKGLDLLKQLFKRNKTIKEMLVEPVVPSNDRYIECFYQSQQPSSLTSLQQHEERHLRRPSLISCRFCNYKTNSQALLKCHVDKNHSWDPAVISKLFKP